jgi:aspartyl/asparaginyl beta-hydroxylase (cupin superfamily)
MKGKVQKKRALTFNYYAGRGETFFESSLFPWSTEIEKNWKQIREEVLQHFSVYEKEYGVYFPEDAHSKKGKWRSFGFYFWGLRLPDAVYDHFEATINILKKVPHVVSISISVMEPGSEIKAHYGETDAIYRCHLPLVASGSLPDIGFQVGYEQRSWQEGKLMIFNDGAYHKAWNNTNKARIVLIVDVLRPELAHKKKWICSKALATLYMQRRSDQKQNKTTRLFFAKLQRAIHTIRYRIAFIFKTKQEAWLI